MPNTAADVPSTSPRGVRASAPRPFFGVREARILANGCGSTPARDQARQWLEVYDQVRAQGLKPREAWQQAERACLSAIAAVVAHRTPVGLSLGMQDFTPAPGIYAIRPYARPAWFQCHRCWTVWQPPMVWGDENTAGRMRGAAAPTVAPARQARVSYASAPSVRRRTGRPPNVLKPRPRIRPAVFSPDQFERPAPTRPCDLHTKWGNVWQLDRDWYLVERDPSAPGGAVVNVYYEAGLIYCTCDDGRRRIGCSHVLAVGEPARAGPR